MSTPIAADRTTEATPPTGVPIESPCVKRCWLDPATGLCEGCGRTIDEIVRWASLGAADRRAIMTALPGRRAGARLPAGSAGR